MASVQSYFEMFHSKIRLDENDENIKLREKRDVILRDLRGRLPNDMPTFTHFHQGSYSLNTGTCPLDGNYDIDIGVVFDCKKDKYTDPVSLKEKVRDALTYLNRTVNIRRPCVTVNYISNGKTEYHVDLAIYVKRDDGLLDIAMGKEHSEASKRIYQVAAPQKLTQLINDRFSGDDAAQFRRCIRYLKRWRDVQFANGGAPLSIALTVAAYEKFQPSKDLISGNFKDLLAMRAWVNNILSGFSFQSTEEGFAQRISVMLPVEPYCDLMIKHTNDQMKVLKEKLTTLYEVLNKAVDEALPEDACKLLSKQFGNEFPVPSKQETAKTVNAPYVSAGTSA